MDSLGLITDFGPHCLSIPRFVPLGNFTYPPLLQVGGNSCATRHALLFRLCLFAARMIKRQKSKFPRAEEIAPSLAYISMRCGGCDILPRNPRPQFTHNLCSLTSGLHPKYPVAAKTHCKKRTKHARFQVQTDPELFGRVAVPGERQMYTIVSRGFAGSPVSVRMICSSVGRSLRFKKIRP